MTAREKRLTENREYIRSKKRVPCADCGKEFPDVCMDFHHLDESAKLDAIKARAGNRSMLWTLCKYSRERIDEELNKCVVLCACCHRIRHHGS
tara:strand:- start:348 stop:626 length:279 start_codon:yes stop_codon:yes gene_type:complete